MLKLASCDTFPFFEWSILVHLQNVNQSNCSAKADPFRPLLRTECRNSWWTLKSLSISGHCLLKATGIKRGSQLTTGGIDTIASTVPHLAATHINFTYWPIETTIKLSILPGSPLQLNWESGVVTAVALSISLNSRNICIHWIAPRFEMDDMIWGVWHGPEICAIPTRTKSYAPEAEKIK